MAPGGQASIYVWKYDRLSLCVPLLVVEWEESAAFLSALDCCWMVDSRASRSFESNHLKESDKSVHEFEWFVYERDWISNCASRVNNSPIHKKIIQEHRLFQTFEFVMKEELAGKLLINVRYWWYVYKVMVSIKVRNVLGYV